MIKKIVIVILYLGIFSFSVPGQNICSFSPEYSNTVSCLTGYAYYNDNINAGIVVDNILSKINLENTYFITKVCNGINNAVAIKYNGFNYILLDVEWMESIKYGKNDWFHLFVIGHEMAHHILKHTDQKTQTLALSRKHELESDEFSGYILGMYGASQIDIENLLLNFPDDNDINSTHPQKKDRILAVQKGYNSSKTSETYTLIQSLTREANFYLSNLPYLLSLAHKYFNLYLSTNDKTALEKAIEYYQEAIRFTSDPQIAYELGTMFLANGMQDRYHSALELAYQNTNDNKYIIELIGNCIEYSDNNLDTYIKKYSNLLNNVNYDNLHDPFCVEAIVKYYMYLARINIENDIIDYKYLEKAEIILSISLKEINSSKLTCQSDYNNLAGINNLMGLCALWRENYDTALKYFSFAKASFDKAENFESSQLENIYKYYSSNKLAVLNNISLCNVRQRNWDDGLIASNEYESLASNFNYETLTYLNKIEAIKYEECYYFKARCLHGLEKYSDAIKYYTLAMKYETKNTGYLYFYRGLSYIGTDNMYSACEDFKKACNEGISDGCNRVSSTCK